jgi:hypothetical protein
MVYDISVAYRTAGIFYGATGRKGSNNIKSVDILKFLEVLSVCMSWNEDWIA